MLTNAQCSLFFVNLCLDINANEILVQCITFVNSAGPEGGQAVALRTAGNNIAIYQCSIQGYQDTLFTAHGQQFFRECEIYGTIDFIFGDAAVVFQNCMIYLRKPILGQDNVIIAQGRARLEKTGTVLHNCTIIASKEFEPYTKEVKTFLGRPWFQHSQTIVMECFLGDLIDPEGWLKYNGEVGLSALHYVEYKNRGPEADTKGRVTWPGYKIANNSNDVQEFTVDMFINGSDWLPSLGVPFVHGLI